MVLHLRILACSSGWNFCKFKPRVRFQAQALRPVKPPSGVWVWHSGLDPSLCHFPFLACTLVWACLGLISLCTCSYFPGAGVSACGKEGEVERSDRSKAQLEERDWTPQSREWEKNERSQRVTDTAKAGTGASPPDPGLWQGMRSRQTAGQVLCPGKIRPRNWWINNLSPFQFLGLIAVVPLLRLNAWLVQEILLVYIAETYLYRYLGYRVLPWSEEELSLPFSRWEKEAQRDWMPRNQTGKLVLQNKL